MLGSPILDSSLNGCGGNGGVSGSAAVGGGGDLADCYSPKLNDSYRGKYEFMSLKSIKSESLSKFV